MGNINQRPKHTSSWTVKPRLHDTTGCETGWILSGWTTGCIV